MSCLQKKITNQIKKIKKYGSFLTQRISLAIQVACVLGTIRDDKSIFAEIFYLQSQENKSAAYYKHLIDP